MLINLQKIKKGVFFIKLYEAIENKNENLSISNIEILVGEKTPNSLIRNYCRELVSKGILVPSGEKFSFTRYVIDKKLLYKEFVNSEYLNILWNQLCIQKL